MARKKDENREKAKQLFLDSEGIMSNPEIAEALGVDSAKVRKWKCIDKWNEALENKPKKKGGQKGNQNGTAHSLLCKFFLFLRFVPWDKPGTRVQNYK